MRPYCSDVVDTKKKFCTMDESASRVGTRQVERQGCITMGVNMHLGWRPMSCNVVICHVSVVFFVNPRIHLSVRSIGFAIALYLWCSFSLDNDFPLHVHHAADTLHHSVTHILSYIVFWIEKNLEVFRNQWKPRFSLNLFARLASQNRHLQAHDG